MPEPDEFRAVTLSGPFGPVEARHTGRRDARAAVVLVGGVGGGFDTPGRDLYVRLARHLPDDGIGVLRVRFRLPGDLEEARADVLAGIAWIGAVGAASVGIVGHSFGGAVAIGAAAASPIVSTVVAISTQSFGTEGITALRDRPVLLVHGTEDEVLPPSSSVQVYRRAGPRSRLELIQGGDHVLDDQADELYELVHGWLVDQLGQARSLPVS